MPNWCSNSLHFEGNPERISEVAEQILIKTDDGYQFSFQHIVPMPEELILPEVPDSYMQLTWLQIAQQPENWLAAFIRLSIKAMIFPCVRVKRGEV